MAPSRAIATRRGILSTPCRYWFSAIWRTHGPVAIKYIPSKLMLNANLAKSRLPITSFSVIKSFCNFAQSTTVTLPCCVQNFRAVWQMTCMLWANRISLDSSLSWVSKGHAYIALALSYLRSSGKIGSKQSTFAHQDKVFQTTKVIQIIYTSVTQLILRGVYKSFTRNEMYTFSNECFEFNALQSYLTCVSAVCIYSPIPHKSWRV